MNDNPFAETHDLGGGGPSKDNPFAATHAATPDEPVIKDRVPDGSLSGDPLWTRIAKTMGDFHRSVDNAATFHGRDRLDSIVSGRKYSDVQAETQQAKERSPISSTIGDLVGSAVGGAGVSKLIGKVLPSLAEPTIARTIGNQALTGAASGVAQDAMDGKVSNPAQVAVNAGASGALAGITGAGLRLFDPMQAVRTAGLGVSGPSKDAAKALMAKSAGMGVPLNAAEALTSTSNGEGTKIRGLFNTDMNTPNGGTIAAREDASRRPGMRSLVDNTYKDLAAGTEGPGYTTSQNAEAGLENVRQSLKDTDRLNYRPAENDIIPSVTHNSNFLEALSNLRNKPAIVEAMGGPQAIDPERVGTAHRIVDELRQIAESHDKRGDTFSAGLAWDDKNQLSNHIRQFSPAYDKANIASREGKTNILDPLENGPLGVIAKGSNPDTQFNQLFGARTPVEGQASLAASNHMDPAHVRGVLAHGFGVAGAKDPVGVADTFQSPHGKLVAVTHTSSDQTRNMNDVMKVMSAVRDAKEPHGEGAHPPTNWITMLRDMQRNWGSGKRMQELHDPAVIDMLGKKGLLQQSMDAATTAGVRFSTDKAMNGR